MAKSNTPARITTVDQAIAKAARTYSRVSAVESIKWAAEKEHIKVLIARSKDLQSAIPETVLQAILQGASMGLTFNPTIGHCYLIPRRSRRKRDDESLETYLAKTFIIASAAPSYKGLSKIITDGNSRVIQIRAEVVFQADKFKPKGPIERPVHEPTSLSTHRKEAFAVGVYAICEFDNGSVSVEYVDSDTVQTIRSMSEFPNSAMYTKLWTEGWRKIAIRRLTKTIPVAGDRMIHAIDAMDHETGITFDNESVIEHDAEPVEDAEIVTEPGLVTTDQVTNLVDKIAESKLDPKKFCIAYDIERIDQLPSHLYDAAIDRLNARIETVQGNSPNDPV